MDGVQMTAGGKAQPIYVVTEDDLASGRFRVAPGPALRVVGADAGLRGVLGGSALPVYVVSDPDTRGVEGGEAILVSNLTGVRAPSRGLAIPVYVVADDGQFAEPVEPPTPFWENLFAFYQVEEASGTRVEEIAARNLAVVLTDPGQTAGKFGNAVSFVGTGYLKSTDVGWQDFQSFSGAFWFYPLDTSFRGWMAVYSGTGAARSWAVLQNSTNLLFTVYPTDGGLGRTATVGAFTANAWNFVAFKYNHSTLAHHARLNGGAWVQASPVISAAMRQGAYPYLLGTGNESVAFPASGRADHVGLWKGYLLTDADYTFLYNGGTGRTWSEIQTYGNAP
jgi:hypothetical protein